MLTSNLKSGGQIVVKKLAKRSFAISYGLELAIFILQRQSCTARTVYQQFFVNRLSNKKYEFHFLSVMRTIQCYECMDGGGRFSRSVYENVL